MALPPFELADGSAAPFNLFVRVFENALHVKLGDPTDVKRRILERKKDRTKFTEALLYSLNKEDEWFFSTFYIRADIRMCNSASRKFPFLRSKPSKFFMNRIMDNLDKNQFIVMLDTLLNRRLSDAECTAFHASYKEFQSAVELLWFISLTEVI